MSKFEEDRSWVKTLFGYALSVCTVDKNGDLNKDSSGDLAVKTTAEITFISGVTVAGEKLTPVVSNTTPPAGQSQIFSAPIKKMYINFADAGGAGAAGLELYLTFSAISDVDAKTRLDTPGLRKVIPLNAGMAEIDFKDYQGALRFDFATSATGTNTRVSWEVVL